MMEKLIYKHTSIAVALLIFVGVLISFVALRNTGALVLQYFDLKSTLAALPDIAPQAAPKKKDAIFKEIDLNAVLFKSITESARTHNIQVKNINTPTVSNNSDIIVLTEEVRLEGGFINTVKCLEEAFRELEQVKLSSVRFERDLTPRSNALFTTVYFQTIRRNESKANN